MGRKIALLLMIGMVLSLWGCAGMNGSLSEEYEAFMSGFEQSQTPMPETGETQLQVRSGLVSFEGSEDGTGELPVDAEDIEGRYVDRLTGTILEIEENGEMTVQRSDGGMTIIETVQWRFSEDGIVISEPVGGSQEYQIVEEDGMLILRGKEGEYVPTTEEKSFETQFAQLLTLGETAKTELVEFTLTGIEFAENVSMEAGSYLLPDSGGSLRAAEGMLLACVTYRVKNVSEAAIAGARLCALALDYDNSETFAGGRYGDINGMPRLLNPQEQNSFTGIIECPILVGEDNDVPLSVDVTLPDSDGDVTFRYVLK